MDGVNNGDIAPTSEIMLRVQRKTRKIIQPKKYSENHPKKLGN
jgi:hypothetical protein